MLREASDFATLYVNTILNLGTHRELPAFYEIAIINWLTIHFRNVNLQKQCQKILPLQTQVIFKTALVLNHAADHQGKIVSRPIILWHSNQTGMRSTKPQFHQTAHAMHPTNIAASILICAYCCFIHEDATIAFRDR